MHAARLPQVVSVEKVHPAPSFLVDFAFQGYITRVEGSKRMSGRTVHAPDLSGQVLKKVDTPSGPIGDRAVEADMVERCISGDQVACSELFHRFYGQLMPICMRYATDADDAKDILQEGFIRIFSNLGSFSGNGHFIGWLKRVMLNSAINHYRTGKRQRKEVRFDDRPRLMGSIEDEASDDQFPDISVPEMLELVQGLSPAYRMVFNLYVMEGWTHEQIATALKISVGASKSNLSRARMHLREKLIKNPRSSSTKRTNHGI